MINILYIHGLGSSSKSSTGRLLSSLSNEKMTFYNPSFSLSPKKALEEINAFIKENNIDMVVGSSMGGFYALQCDCKYGVVINPALTPIKDIKSAVGYGEHPTPNNDGTFIIDEEFFRELDDIIRRNYQGDDPNEWYKSFDKEKVFAGIFGEQDELFSHYEDFHSINSDLVVLLGAMHHRFDANYIEILMILIEDVAKNIK